MDVGTGRVLLSRNMVDSAGRAARYVWVIPLFVVSTAVMGFLSVLVGAFSAPGSRRFARWWATMNMHAMGIKTEVSGLENLPNDGGGFIIASNHRSAADIGAVLQGIPADVCWVTKASLLKIPFLGWHLKAVHIPVQRSTAGNTNRFLEDGAEKVKNGATVVIFPEGTRNRTGELLLPFKKGTFLLAQAAQRPIVPIAIKNSAEVWPISRFLPLPGSIHISIGEPMDISEFQDSGLQAISQATRQAMSELLER